MKATPPKPANVLEASQYRDPLAVYEAPRRLTREDLERAKAALLDAGKSRQEFMLFLDANAAEVATWPQWKRDAYTLIREKIDG